jgi:rhamnosyl/mannosyltransferase
MDVGGTDEAVIHGETGILTPPNDPVALAAAIRSLIDNSQLACRLAQAGKDRARREFSCEIMVERVTAIYDQILTAQRSAR